MVVGRWAIVGVFVGGCGSWWMVAVVGGCGSWWMAAVVGVWVLSCGVVVYGCVTQETSIDIKMSERTKKI